MTVRESNISIKVHTDITYSGSIAVAHDGKGVELDIKIPFSEEETAHKAFNNILRASAIKLEKRRHSPWQEPKTE